MADSAPAKIIIYNAYIWANKSSKLIEKLNTNTVVANNIISRQIIIKIRFLLFNMNPSIPIKNINNPNFMLFSCLAPSAPRHPCRVTGTGTHVAVCRTYTMSSGAVVLTAIFYFHILFFIIPNFVLVNYYNNGNLVDLLNSILMC